MAEILEADLTRDVDVIKRLWLAYLTWGNDGLEERYAFRLPVQEAVEHDLKGIHKFEPPNGRLALAFESGTAIGTAAMHTIGPGTAEIKRMWVDPEYRGAGVGRALLARLIADAGTAGYQRIRLDSPDFMTNAHALYRSSGFTDIEPYPESEIPDEHKSHWVFMELLLPSTETGAEPSSMVGPSVGP